MVEAEWWSQWSLNTRYKSTKGGTIVVRGRQKHRSYWKIMFTIKHIILSGDYWRTFVHPFCDHSDACASLLPRLSDHQVTDLLGDLCATVLIALKTSWRPWHPWWRLAVLCATCERPRQLFGLRCASNGDLVSFVVAQVAVPVSWGHLDYREFDYHWISIWQALEMESHVNALHSNIPPWCWPRLPWRHRLKSVHYPRVVLNVASRLPRGLRFEYNIPLGRSQIHTPDNVLNVNNDGITVGNLSNSSNVFVWKLLLTCMFLVEGPCLHSSVIVTPWRT